MYNLYIYKYLFFIVMSRPKFRPTVYELNKENNFKTKVSTTTNDEFPNVVFLRAKVRLTPIENKKSYENEIISLKDNFRSFAMKLLDANEHYDKNYIFNIDVSEKSVRFKKTSHLRYDLFVKPKTQLTLEKHKDILKDLSDKLDDKLIELFKKYKLQWN